MPRQPTRPSLKRLAKECGLSIAAVSMALRRHPEISTATADRVIAHAKKIGYRTNPLLHSVMSHVRSGNVSRMWLSFAFIWLDATPEESRHNEFHVRTFNSIMRRANQVGLHVEQFYLAERGMTAKRLQQILLTRGINGIIFSPSANISEVDLSFDWSKFSVVVMGNVAWSIDFNRAGQSHYHGMCRALREVDRLGYKHPAVILKENLNERARRTPQAAFLAFHPSPDRATSLIYHLNDDANPHFKDWFKSTQPDCLIFPFIDGYATEIGEMDLSRYPHAALDIVSHLSTAGICYEFDAIGANAVDLLTTQLLHNERGVPARAQLVLTEGHWRDAESLPKSRPIRGLKVVRQ